jgi:EF hand domain-containing protein
MKTTLKVILTILTLGAAGFVAQAQDDGGPPDGGPQGGQGFHHRPPPLPLARALDVNHDGIIDSNEIANASAELLTLDKNGDGQLTKDEYLPPHPPGADSNFHPPRSPLVEALDVNHDGIIDASEIANAPAELLTLDKNGDGQLTPDEYRPHRPHRPPGPPPGGDDSSNDGPPGPPPGGDLPDGGPPGPPPNQ